jgi:hypothetical protein
MVGRGKEGSESGRVKKCGMEEWKVQPSNAAEVLFFILYFFFFPFG